MTFESEIENRGKEYHKQIEENSVTDLNLSRPRSFWLFDIFTNKRRNEILRSRRRINHTNDDPSMRPDMTPIRLSDQISVEPHHTGVSHDHPGEAAMHLADRIELDAYNKSIENDAGDSEGDHDGGDRD